MNRIKKNLALILCTLTTMSLAACGSTSIQTANPFTDCESLEEAVEKAGFDVTLPDVPEGYLLKDIRVIKDSLIEITLESSTDTITLRKSLGDEDNSGDYNQYSETRTIEIDGVTTEMRGEEDNVHVLSWQSGKFFLSISSTKGLSTERVTELFRSFNALQSG